LDVRGSNISSSALAGLKSMPRLNELGINADQADFDGWESLKLLTQVREIYIGWPNAPAVEKLADLSHLRTISSRNAPSATSALVAMIQSKNAHCRILAAGKVVGSDPFHDAIRKLLARGAKISGTSLSQWAPQEIRSDMLNGTQHYVVHSVLLPPEATLSD